MIRHRYELTCDDSPAGDESTRENPVCSAWGADTIEGVCECARDNGWLVEEGLTLCRRHRAERNQ